MASISKKRSSAAATVDDLDSSKRAKTNTTNKLATPNPDQSRSKVDANGDRFWEISKMRRITVSSFRGKRMVNIREYYEKDGQELPGKKVIEILLDFFTFC